MNYFIVRDDQQYGPYTLSDLQSYVASGHILPTDLATGEGLATPVPVSQIIGNIAMPPPAFSSAIPLAPVSIHPDPPNLHWALVLLFSVLSCGLFQLAWDLVLAAWMKRVAPQSKAILWYGGAGACLLGTFLASFAAVGKGSGWVSLFQLTYTVLLLIGRFSLRSSMEEHYNGPDPIGLSLSGVMTFFFGCIYFQYHVNDIVKRKQLDRLALASY